MLKVSHLSELMANTKKTKHFNIGDRVYGRFFGSDILLIEDIFKTESGFLHCICSIRKSKYVVPCIHLSTKMLINTVNDGNRKQLRLFN